MITIIIKKDIELQKYFVVQWVFTPKSKHQDIEEIPGTRYHIPLNEIPEGFYKNPYDYFLDGKILRVYPK